MTDLITREKTTVSHMIAIYCRHHHAGTDRLCDECTLLLDYALSRLDKCPKGCAKSSCRKCEIHCYSPDYREQIRRVMRYSGPRMIFCHPAEAILHLITEFR